MPTVIMSQPWLWKRGSTSAIDAYVGVKDEPVIDLRSTPPLLRIMDGVTPGGIIADSGITTGITAPNFYTPTYGANNLVEDLTFTTDEINAITPDITPDTHVASYWEIAIDAGFTNIVYSSGRSTTDLTRLDLTTKNVLLANSTTHYTRVRYEGAITGVSPWSATMVFTVKGLLSGVKTDALFISEPNSNFGDFMIPTPDNNGILISAYSSDTGSQKRTGNVYYYTRNASTGEWTLKQTLLFTEIVAELNFGRALAISDDGTKLIVGAPGVSNNSTVQPRVYIYNLVNGSWVQDSIIKNSWTAGTLSNFGRWIETNGTGTQLLISDHLVNAGAVQSGAVYRYVYDGVNSVWNNVQTIVNSDLTAGYNFGTGLSLSADNGTLLISAYGKEAGATVSNGGGYIFAFDGTNWIEKSILTHSLPQTQAWVGIGYQLSPDGLQAFLGSNTLDINGNVNAGGIFVFTHDIVLDTWSETQLITVDGTSFTSDYFGRHISLSPNGQTLASAASNRKVNGLNGQGEIFIYNKDAQGTWNFSHSITLPLGDISLSLGRTIVLGPNGDMLFAKYYKPASTGVEDLVSVAVIE